MRDIKLKYPTATWDYTKDPINGDLRIVCSYEDKIATATFPTREMLEGVAEELAEELGLEPNPKYV